MMGGLLVATALTLLFLPALYAAWFRVRKPADAGAYQAQIANRESQFVAPGLGGSAL